MSQSDHTIATSTDAPARRRGSRRAPIALTWLVLLLCASFLSGCASQQWAKLRSAPKNSLTEQFDLKPDGALAPSDRTRQLLRLYDLEGDLQGDPDKLLATLQSLQQQQPSLDKLYALAELSYQAARRIEHRQRQKSLDLYGASVIDAYQYLFDLRFHNQWNPYDPHFRGACDLYNGSLEAGLRLICANEGFKPGQRRTIQTAAGTWDVEVRLRGGRWKNEDFDQFKFVSDYTIEGLRNHYRSYGLGVPMIAVRHGGREGEPEQDKYYPVDLSFPVTVLLRPEEGFNVDNRSGAVHRRAVLEIYDPLTIADIAIHHQHVPLESDLSTPLAYFLSKSELEQLATVGLIQPEKLIQRLRPGKKDPIMGLYMMEPYDPNKIPVLFVHGLWSSPITWIQIFNDLSNDPEIRRNYQFWFYLYPTGEPYWIAAARLRRDLAEARAVLDPRREYPALDQMIAVGHSMGGLIARLQTFDSQDDFWRVVSDRSFAELKADPETRQRLHDVLFFQPNPSIQRVITIATPHRGSKFSNDTTQWLLGKLISLPEKLVGGQERLVRDNRQLFRDTRLFSIKTSVDSLSPASPMFPAMLAARRAPWVRYHNVVGLVPNKGLVGEIFGGTDTVVSRESAHLDDVESELTVEADHSTVHIHPRTVLEVRRILLEHIATLRSFAGSPIQTAPIQTAPIQTATLQPAPPR